MDSTGCFVQGQAAEISSRAGLRAKDLQSGVEVAFEPTRRMHEDDR